MGLSTERDELDDLLDGSPKDGDADVAVNALLDSGGMPDAAMFRRPVNLTFLAKVLGTEPRRLIGKLSRCPIIGYETRGRAAGSSPLYDFKEAIQYCVKPKIDIATWIKSQSSATLPPAINKACWEAEFVKMKVMREAGDLWHTHDCQRVFGRTAMTINEATSLWIEHLPGVEQMSTEQYEKLRKQVISLQRTVTDILIDNVNEARTESYVRDIEKVLLTEVDDEGDDE